MLGKFLVLGQINQHRVLIKKSLMVTEVEAYNGAEDLACHASRGRTARTETLFAAGGVWYVYLCYGMYWMLNIVTGEKDRPEAVLIRGARHVDRDSGLYVGPGKLTKNLNIDKRFHNLLAKPYPLNPSLYFEDRGIIVTPKQIKTAPRIGVSYAGPIWSQKPWRFLLK